MKLSTQEEYGLRCLMQVAQRASETGGSISIPEISRAEGLSTAHVGKLVRLLRLGALVERVRGQAGGYKLARAASDTRPSDVILISDVLGALGDPFFNEGFCDEHTGYEECCTHSVDCSIRSLWNAIQFVVDQMLDRITLQDLMGDGHQLENHLAHKADELLQVTMP
ncbi:MAG: Rrf2 family transcriptional regulator [Gemmatimonadota bacterium]|nr:Rrf2 family transcriptional regulator [Gemmatimonadota bacterium]